MSCVIRSHDTVPGPPSCALLLLPLKTVGGRVSTGNLGKGVGAMSRARLIAQEAALGQAGASAETQGVYLGSRGKPGSSVTRAPAPHLPVLSGK